jgi:hypothetical protein
MNDEYDKRKVHRTPSMARRFVATFKDKLLVR